MPGETDLDALIRSMRPRLLPGVFTYVSVPADYVAPFDLRPLMTFREKEGTTLVVEAGLTEAARLKQSFLCRVITLTVHSALDSVGFLAVVTSRLAEAGIAVNAVSAFHHDHLFVPPDRAEEALRLLDKVSGEGLRQD